MAEQWVPVRSDMPCPVCGSLKWCMIHRSGRKAICPKVKSCEKFMKGTDDNYVHRLNTQQAKLLRPRLDATPENIRPEIDFEAVLTSLERVTTSRHRLGLCTELAPNILEDKHALYYRVVWSEAGKCWMMPMYHDGEICGMHRRFLDGGKAFVKGSKGGLFVPVGPVPPEIYVCEGFSDTICSFAAGFWSIGRVSAKTGYEQVMRFLLRNEHVRRVTVVADQDGPGLLGAKRLYTCLVGRVAADVVVPGEYDDVRSMLNAKATVQYQTVDIG